jgi:hypothetical protein
MRGGSGAAAQIDSFVHVLNWLRQPGDSPLSQASVHDLLTAVDDVSEDLLAALGDMDESLAEPVKSEAVRASSSVKLCLLGLLEIQAPADRQQ